MFPTTGLRPLLACVAFFAGSASHAQRNFISQTDAFEPFVGTWIAANANETAPYMILRLEERGGKLVGTMNHFRFGVVGPGNLVGSEFTPGDIPLADLIVNPGVFWFTWRGNPPFEGFQARFVAEGTRVAELVFILTGNSAQRIMAENPRASGLNPVISLTRVSPNSLHELVRGDVVSPRPKPSQKWEISAMARLINTAEVQYKVAHGQYADYSTLIRSGQLRETGAQEFTLLPGNLRRGGTAAESDPLPGYSLRLVLAADKKSYRVSMREKTSGPCGYDVATDETGIVTELSVRGAQCQ